MVGIFAPIFEIYLTLNWHSFAHEDLAGNPIKVHLEAGIRIKKQTFWKPSFEKMRRLLWESGVFGQALGINPRAIHVEHAAGRGVAEAAAVGADVLIGDVGLQ